MCVVEGGEECLGDGIGESRKFLEVSWVSEVRMAEKSCANKHEKKHAREYGREMPVLIINNPEFMEIWEIGLWACLWEII